MKNLPKFSEYKDQKTIKPVKESKNEDEITIKVEYKINIYNLVESVLDSFDIYRELGRLLHDNDIYDTKIGDIEFDNIRDDFAVYITELTNTKESFENIDIDNLKIIE